MCQLIWITLCMTLYYEYKMFVFFIFLLNGTMAPFQSLGVVSWFLQVAYVELCNMSQLVWIALCVTLYHEYKISFFHFFC